LGDSRFPVVQKESSNLPGGEALLVVAADIEIESCHSAIVVVVLARLASLAYCHLGIELRRLEDIGHCPLPFLAMI